jgi:hypothetical protein
MWLVFLATMSQIFDNELDEGKFVASVGQVCRKIEVPLGRLLTEQLFLVT